ncbi:MAG: carbohydrate binding domain-containing protein [Candidatus Omnitrophota bacterium]
MLRVLIIACIAAIFLPADGNAVMIGRNILPNASFENRPGFRDEDPREWGSWNSSFNGLCPTERRKGQQSIYLLCPKQGDSTGVFYTYRKVIPGNKYIFRCYALNSREDPVSGDSYGQISIEWRKMTKDKDGKDVPVEISRDYGKKFGANLPYLRWTLISLSAIAPQDADNCNFVVQYVNSANGSGKFFVDDASVEEIEKKAALKDYMLGRSYPRNVVTTVAVPPSSPASGSAHGPQLLVADYNSGSKPNNLGGDMGIWNRDPNDKTQGCNMNFSTGGHDGKGYMLELDYDVDSPNEALDGYWMAFPDQDLSRYKSLILWIKGDGSLGFSKNMKLEIKNSKGEQGQYTLSGITGEWKRFAIPLKSFSGLNDFSSVKEFVIRFDDKVNADRKQGRVYIDDIGFGD